MISQNRSGHCATGSMANVVKFAVLVVTLCAGHPLPLNSQGERHPQPREDFTEQRTDSRTEETDFQWVEMSVDYEDNVSLSVWTFQSSDLDDGSAHGSKPQSIWLPRSRPDQDRRPAKRRIYGVDNRECSDRTDRLPYSAIGYIAGTMCTAFLVAPNLAMTAASCLYDKKKDDFYHVNFDFYRGDTSTFKGERMVWKTVIVPSSYIHRKWSENDYGFVVLANKSDEYLGVMVRNFTSNLPIKILSYSSDKDDCIHTVNCSASLLRHSWYEEQERNQKLFCYHCDTLTWSTGGPILFNDFLQLEDGTTIKPGLMAVGVNVGYLPLDFSSHSGCNVGSRITDKRLEIIEQLSEEFNDS